MAKKKTKKARKFKAKGRVIAFTIIGFFVALVAVLFAWYIAVSFWGNFSCLLVAIMLSLICSIFAFKIKYRVVGFLNFIAFLFYIAVTILWLRLRAGLS